MRDGISGASGLHELWIAGRDHGRLDYGGDGLDQQLLQAAGSERDSVHGAAARNGGEIPQEPLIEIAWAFALPGQWTSIDATLVDFDPNTGELTLPWNVLGLPFNEVQATYTAGLAAIGDDVKSACAQIVRNAQATPALNASMSRIDTMQIKYFSSSLIDETVQAWLNPYVANRLG